MQEIRNIYCVGRNYVAHAKELNNEVPSSPFLFLKPTHAYVEANGQEIYLPGNRGSVHFETELVIRIGRQHEAGMKANEVIGSMGIGSILRYGRFKANLRKRDFHGYWRKVSQIRLLSVNSLPSRE